MSTTARERLRVAIAATALLPALTALVLVRPAGALVPIGFHALTYSAAAVAPEGEVGAGGGLLPIDGGAPLVRGRVEAAPSSSSVAASVEPGTLWSTIAGVVNTEAGEEVIATPTRAEALYPGVGEGSANQFGPEEAGPIRVGMGTALAQAREGFATGRAELASYAITDGGQAAGRTLAARLAALRVRYPAAASAAQAEGDADGSAVAVRGGHAYGHASAAPARGVLEVEARTRADELRVADQVVLRGVTGHAAVRVENGSRTPRAELRIAEASVGPFPVAVTPEGVRFAGQGLPAQQVADLSAALNEALAAAGVTLRLEPARTSASDGAAEADSGAVRMAIQTPSDGGVPGNILGVIVGRAVVTSVDEPERMLVWQESPGLMPAPIEAAEPVGTGGPAFTPGAAEAPVSAVAPRKAPPMLMVAGRAIPASAALAAFAVWQLLSLSTSTLAAIVLRDRESSS